MRSRCRTLHPINAPTPYFSPPPPLPLAADPNTLPSTSQSPVPYLFGGLSAMLGLVAFSLLILACSETRRLSRRLSGGGGDPSAGEGGKPGSDAPMATPVLEEKVVVIMAGDDRPTFLAMPVPISLAAGSVSASPSSSAMKHEEAEPEKGPLETEQSETQNT